MIKPLLHGVKFHTSPDKMFSLSKGYRFHNDDLVFDSYKQVWWAGGAFQWHRDNTHDPEYFNSLDQFVNKHDVEHWLNEL